MRLWAALGIAASLGAATPGPGLPEDMPAPAAPAAVEPGPVDAELEGGVEPAADPGAGHPYQAITLRNSFGLREPPPPAVPPPETAPPVNTTALKLTGLTTLLGKRAMFVFNDGKTNKVSGLVSEGERDRFLTDLEVLEIDAVERRVKVVFGGQELQLDFVNNGLMPPTNVAAIAAVAGRPGAAPRLPTLPGQRTVNLGNPGNLPAANPAFGAGGIRSVPTRPTRLGSAGGSTVQPMPLAGAADYVGGAPTAEPLPAMPTLTPDQQVMLLREQHEFARQNNIELPPMPPAPGLEDLSRGPGDMPPMPLQPPGLP
jgi:hypothetical protein